MDRSWDNPNYCLASEYDLESGIVDGLRLLRVKLANDTTSKVTKMKKLPLKTLRGKRK
jgi:hypothetical protein